MHPEDVLAHTPIRLSDAERRFYFTNGYLAVDGAISPGWIARLRAATEEIVERSREVTENGAYVLEEGHCAETPRLHRLMSPEAHHPAFREFIASDGMTALAADVVGPNVKFHHAKLNFKSGRGSRGFKWHQDIPAWPHTDYSPVTIGVYIEGCSSDQGPLAMVRGSNHGALYTQYDHHGNYTVSCRERRTSGGCATTWSMRRPEARVPRCCCTAAPSTARAPIAPTPRGRCSLRCTRAPTPSPTPRPPSTGRTGAPSCAVSRRATHASTRAPCELPPDWARAGYAGPWELQKNAESARGD